MMNCSPCIADSSRRGSHGMQRRCPAYSRDFNSAAFDSADFDEPSAHRDTTGFSIGVTVGASVCRRRFALLPDARVTSRYVLYDDGTFALQYTSANYPFFEYRGTYEEANDLITFVDGETGTGTLGGDSLAVGTQR